MKLSLRSLALGSAILVAGAAMAQTPTVTKVWSYDIAGLANGSARFGTGVNGKVYYGDKAEGKVKVVDADGVKDFAEVAGCGIATSSDDAGNILVNKGFPGATSANNWAIIEPDGTVHDVTFAMPEGVTANRIDQVGRVAGNMMSEEGAFVFLGCNTATNVATIYIQNGEQATHPDVEYYTGENSPATINTSTVINPYYSFEELLTIADDPANVVNGYVVRNRSSHNSVYYYDFDNMEFAIMKVPSNSNTQEGFDVFELGGVRYLVAPVKKAVNYESAFAIVNQEDGTVLYEVPAEDVLGNGGQNFGSFCAHKVSDTKVELYQFYVGPAGVGARAAMYEISAQPLYICGSEFGWDPSAPVELQAENGVYSYTFAQDSAPEFKISTTKSETAGDWTAFNAGGFNVEGGNGLAGAGEYTLVPNSDPANISLPKGNWAMTIDLAASKLTITGEAAAFEVPALYYRGSINGDDHWNDAKLPMEVKADMTDNGEYEYVVEIEGGVTAGDEFKIGTENWSEVQFSASKAIDLATGTHEMHFKWEAITSFAEDLKPHARLTFYYNPDHSKSSWLKIEKVNSMSGVENIEAAEEGEAVYFNLQGVRVANPAAGSMYIKVQNGKASKQLVK